MTTQSTMLLRASWSTLDPITSVSCLRAATMAATDEPPSYHVDGKDLRGHTFAEAFATSTRLLRADYPGNVRSPPLLAFDRATSILQTRVADRPIDVPTFASSLATIPFGIASFESSYGSAWGDPFVDDDAYVAPSFSEGHVSLGWGAAFRGSGHDRLVSPNWLRGGPFKVWTHGDVSLVQFHALEADAATALEQAKPGHREIGITDDTGFLQTNFVYTLDLSGLYEPATRTMKIVVLGRELPNRELLEWAAIRKLRPDPARIVDTVAFVFPQEAEARTNLARLWRYGHQVWAIRGGVEVRLDEGYEPPDTTPSWAR